MNIDYLTIFLSAVVGHFMITKSLALFLLKPFNDFFALPGLALTSLAISILITVIV